MAVKIETMRKFSGHRKTSLKCPRTHVSDLICYYSLLTSLTASITITLGLTQLSRYCLSSDMKWQDKTYLRSFQWILVLAAMRCCLWGAQLPVRILARIQVFSLKPFIDFLTQVIRMNHVEWRALPLGLWLSLSSFCNSQILPSAYYYWNEKHKINGLEPRLKLPTSSVLSL